MAFDISYALILRDKFSKVAHKINTSIEGIEKQTSKASEKMEKFGMHMSAMGHRMLIPVAGMVMALKEGFHAADQQIVAYQTLGMTIGKNNPMIKQMIGYTEELEGSTRITQEAYMQSAMSIAQFTKSGKAAYIALKPLANMATARHMDLQAMTNMFTQSLTGTTNLLQRYGIIIDNSLRGKAREMALINAMQAKFKGAADIAGKTGLGPLLILIHEIGAEWKNIALRIFPMINPVIEKITAKVKVMQEWMSKHQKVAKAIGIILVGMMGLAAVIATLTLIITGLTMANGILLGSLVKATKIVTFLINPFNYLKIAAVGLRAATIALGVGFKVMLGPVGLVITAIGLLATGIIYAYKHSATFRAIVNDIGMIIKNNIIQNVRMLVYIFKVLGTVVKNAFAHTKQEFLWLWHILQKLIAPLKAVGGFMSKIFSPIKKGFSDYFHGLRKSLDQTVSKIPTNINSHVNMSGGYQALSNTPVVTNTHVHVHVSDTATVRHSVDGSPSNFHVGVTRLPTSTN